MGHGLGHGGRRFPEHGLGQNQPGVAFLEHQPGLAPVAQEHQVGLPMAGEATVVRLFGTLGQGAA